MEDLGEGRDFESIYSQKSDCISNSEIEYLIKYLKELHNLNIPQDLAFKNKEMRQLNYDYIFKLPFDESINAIDLDTVTPGLQDLSLNYRNHVSAGAAKVLGEVYWEDSSCLIHGDFYPKSWMKTEDGLYIIDPEFGFLGRPEIDLGFFLAHMLFGGQFERTFKLVKNHYGDFDEHLVAQFCAVEVLRRILFVAQLPIRNDLNWKKNLLDMCTEALHSRNIYGLEDIK